MTAPMEVVGLLIQHPDDGHRIHHSFRSVLLLVDLLNMNTIHT